MGLVQCPLEFRVAPADWPSSQVTMTQVCIKDRSHAYLGWVLVGRTRMGGRQPLPGLSVFPLLLSSQPAASSFYRHHHGEIFGNISHSRAHLAEQSCPSGLIWDSCLR